MSFLPWVDLTLGHFGLMLVVVAKNSKVYGMLTSIRTIVVRYSTLPVSAVGRFRPASFWPYG